VSGGLTAGKPSRAPLSAEYQILTYQRALRDDVLRLFRMLGAQGLDRATAEAVWRWKYEENPYLREPLALVAADASGSLIGMLGIYGSMWQSGDPRNRVVVPCPADAYVASPHRRRGVYRRLFAQALALAREQGYDYVFSLNSSKETYLCNVQLGARSLGYRLPSMHWRGPGVSANDRGVAVRITPRRMLDFARGRFLSATARTPALQRVVRSAYRRSFPAKAGGPFKLLDAGAAAGELNGTGIEATAAPRPEAMAALVERVVHDGRSRHVKDGEYLSWRFRRPGARYRFLFLGGDDLEGYAVLSPRGGRISVVDWEVVHPDLLADLLRSAIGLGRFPVLSVHWVGPSGPTIDALERIGFTGEDAEATVSGESPFTVEVNVLRKSPHVAWMLGESNLLDPLDWDLRPLYADGQ
jgi:GNAT superfamily N-acetyltransferase